MVAGSIEALLERADFGAVRVCESQGPGVLGKVEPFLAHRNREVRLVALTCVAVAGGPKAPELLTRMLRDSDEQVRVNAVNELDVHLPVGREPELLAVWDSTADRYLKQHLPMVLGRLRQASLIPELEKRSKAAADSAVQDGFIAALAKLGDGPARVRFGEQLKAARGERVREMSEYVTYVDDPWVLPYLLPVLDRREPALYLSTHIKETIRRGCDLAVDNVLRIAKQQKFSFALDEAGQYKDAQIDEIRRFLLALPPPLAARP